jgi:hypothetical protein
MHPISVLMLAESIEADRRRQIDRQRAWEPDEGPARIGHTPTPSPAPSRPRLTELPARG